MLTTFDRASAHAPTSVSRLRLRSAVLAWMAALALAGCGGGGDDTTQTDTTTDSGAEASVERAGPSGHWIIDQDYNGFRLIYDCTDRTALHYRYTLQADTGSAARPSTFTFDPTLPAGCLQQTSTASYESVHPGYDPDEATSPGVQPGVERSSRNGLLLFDVLTQDFDWRSTTRRGEVGRRPQDAPALQPRMEVSEFLAQQAR